MEDIVEQNMKMIEKNPLFIPKPVYKLSHSVSDLSEFEGNQMQESKAAKINKR